MAIDLLAKQPIDLLAGEQAKVPVINSSSKKSPWSAVGADITTQMKEKHPILSAIAKTGQDVSTIPANFLNQFLLNAPRALLNKAGYSFPDTDNKVAKTSANIAGIVGGLRNPLKIANPILAGATYGSLYSNEDNVDLNSKSLLNRVVGATTGGVGGSIMSGLGKAFNSGNVINRFIGTRKKDFLFGRNPGQAIADEGIIANDVDDLSNKVSDRLTDYGKKIGDALFIHSNKKINITDALNPLDEAIETAVKNNNQALVTRLGDAKTALTNKLALDSGGKIQVQHARDITKLSPQEATEVKRIVGEMTRFTGDISADKYSNKALLKVYGAIRNKIEQVAPEVKPLNQKYADLKAAQIAINRKDFSKVPVTNVIGGVTRGAIGGLLASGGNPYVAVAGAVAEPIVERLINNAKSKTVQSLIYKTAEKAKQKMLSTNQELLGIANILNSTNNQ